MRGGTVRTPFKKGDMVLVKEEIGSKKGEFRGHHEITHVRPHAKSYFCKDLETGRTYLRSQDRIKLDPSFRPPNVEAKTVVLICSTVPLRGILKKPGSKSNIKKNVCFDASFHTARIVAKQSIKEWKEANKEST